MPTVSYPKRTEQKVLDSDRTSITNHGKPDGGSALARKLAKVYNHPWIHIDMDMFLVFEAGNIISSWINSKKIHVLNVASPIPSKDPKIYNTTMEVLE